MSIFWTMFFLGFIGFPVVILIASLTSGKDSGFQRDTSHIWVYKRSRAKVKNASVRDVWEHQHPGKSWADHQESIFITFTVILVLGFLFFLFWLSGEIFTFPQTSTAQRLFWQIGAPVLGGLSAGVFIGIQSFITNYKSGFLRILHILALTVMVVGMIGALIFTFLEKDLPVSHHWVWVPAGMTGFLLFLDSGIGGQKKKRSRKGGDELMGWVMAVMDMGGRWDLDQLEALMVLSTLELKKGEFDWKLRQSNFFNQTEDLMLDLVSGRSMSIENKEIYRARDQVIKALQTFYFYCVDKFPEYKLHPRIKKALKKT